MGRIGNNTNIIEWGVSRFISWCDLPRNEINDSRNDEDNSIFLSTIRTQHRQYKSHCSIPFWCYFWVNDQLV